MNEEGRIEVMENALHRITQWCDAYPLDMFREPTRKEWKEANDVLNSVGLSIGLFSSSMARHVLTGIARIAKEAKQDGGTDATE